MAVAREGLTRPFLARPDDEARGGWAATGEECVASDALVACMNSSPFSLIQRMIY